MIGLVVASCSTGPAAAPPTSSPAATVAPTASTAAITGTDRQTTSRAPTTSVTTTSVAPDIDPVALEVLCDVFLPEVSTGYVADAGLDEISGVAFGRRNPGLIWVHNDSGGASRLFGLSPSGETVATVTLTGTFALDWEDMSAGPGDPAAGSAESSGHFALYVADIGDNLRIRPMITIYRLPEPRIDGDDLTIDVSAERLDLTYPDGRYDAETLLVDPITRELVVVTKTGGGIYVAAGDFSQESVVMTAAGRLAEDDLLVTGGDIDGAGGTIVIRTPDRVLLFAREPGESVASALQGPSCDLPVVAERQGESVAITPEGSIVVTISEGLNPAINRMVAP